MEELFMKKNLSENLARFSELILYLLPQLLEALDDHSDDEIEDEEGSDEDEEYEEDGVVLPVVANGLLAHVGDITCRGDNLHPSLKRCLSTKHTRMLDLRRKRRLLNTWSFR